MASHVRRAAGRLPLAFLVMGLLALAAGPARATPDREHSGQVTARSPSDAFDLDAPEGLTFVALEGDAGDVDLEVVGDQAYVGASSFPEEAIFVRSRPGTPLHATVALVGGERCRYTVAWDACAVGPALEAGEEISDTVNADSVDTFPLEGEAGSVVRVRVTTASEGLQLLILDENLRIVARATPEQGGGAVAVRLPEGCERTIAVRSDDAHEASYTLACEAGATLLPFDTFLEQLATTEDQAAALAALRGHPDFLRIWEYVRDLPDRYRIRFRAVPGLGRSSGVERFGSWGDGVLVINPTHPEHQANPQELMDTVLHEMVHALLDRPHGAGYPLPDDALDVRHDDRLRGMWGLGKDEAPPRLRPYLDAHYGDSASNPEEEYIDINDVSQRFIIKVIQENIERTGIGHETLIFTNERRRREADAPAPRGAGRREF